MLRPRENDEEICISNGEVVSDQELFRSVVQLVFAQVLELHLDAESEISAIEVEGKKAIYRSIKNFLTSEEVEGLKSGPMSECSSEERKLSFDWSR